MQIDTLPIQALALYWTATTIVSMISFVAIGLVKNGRDAAHCFIIAITLGTVVWPAAAWSAWKDYRNWCRRRRGAHPKWWD